MNKRSGCLRRPAGAAHRTGTREGAHVWSSTVEGTPGSGQVGLIDVPLIRTGSCDRERRFGARNRSPQKGARGSHRRELQEADKAPEPSNHPRRARVAVDRAEAGDVPSSTALLEAG
jgi:hypothetical protein